jgi:hypothetical protein
LQLQFIVPVIVHAFYTFPGYTHQNIPYDLLMLSRVQAWFGKYAGQGTTGAKNASRRLKFHPIQAASESVPVF